MSFNLFFSELEQADKDKWEQFVSGKLAEINKRNNTDLVSGYIYTTRIKCISFIKLSF